jgi:hypothetical protein
VLTDMRPTVNVQPGVSNLVHRLALALLLLPIALTIAAGTSVSAQQVDTRIVVRALANDAKLIGDRAGGARVTIRHADTGAFLAGGMITGDTGDTQGIMSPRERGGVAFDTQGAASFATSLPIESPTPIEIVVEAPLGVPEAYQRASKTLLLVPGVHLEGPGVIIELNGMAVTVLEAPVSAAPGESLSVTARIEMLCGCPIAPDGLWDSNRMDLRVDIADAAGRLVSSHEMTWTGAESTFAARFNLPSDLEAGLAWLRVMALDPERANTGMAEEPLRVVR